jgi:hypothetical protein
MPGMPGMPGMGGGQVIQPNVPVTGVFSPGLPISPEGRPYMDYTLNVPTGGMYTITLMSSNPSSYDPYLYLLMGGNTIAQNDDAIQLNSQISQQLMPGTYTVRVSCFLSVSSPTSFTLTVTGG